MAVCCERKTKVRGTKENKCAEQHGVLPLKKNKTFSKKCANFFTILIFTAYYNIKDNL